MKNNASSVIIKVKDIDICRSFYRNIMNMGDPVVNSNFRVEFVMGNNANLILFLNHETDLKESTAVPCLELNETTAQTCARLDTLDYHYECVSQADKHIYRMRDPEDREIMFTGYDEAHLIHKPKRRRTTAPSSR